MTMWLPAGCLVVRLSFTRLGFLSTTVPLVGELTVVLRQLIGWPHWSSPYKVTTEFLTIDFVVMVGFGRAGWPGQHIPVARDWYVQFQVFCLGLA
jgi:hypothetical protein